MDLKAVEEVVAKIQGRLFKNSNSYSIGMMKSHFRGSGLQFKEHQVYCHGDDVRFIDWKLLARTNTPYVKTFEEERNVEIVVGIDLATSMYMGVDGLSKLQAAINIGCLLCLIAEQTQDYIHFVLFGSEVIELPMANGKKAIVQLVNELRKLNIVDENGHVIYSDKLSKRIDQKKIIRVLNRYFWKRKEVVLLSDFNDFLGDDDILQVVRHKYTHAFRIVCPLDINQDQQFLIYGKEPSSKSNGFYKIKSGDKHSALIRKYGNHIKVLNVAERYLEEFVREMV